MAIVTKLTSPYLVAPYQQRETLFPLPTRLISGGIRHSEEFYYSIMEYDYPIKSSLPYSTKSQRVIERNIQAGTKELLQAD